jgi:hypothetical protein
METEDVRNSIDLQDEIERNLKFSIGVITLLTWQTPEGDMSPEIVQPVMWELETRLCMVKDDIKVLCNRLSAFTAKEKEKADAIAKEARKNRPISDEEIEAARGVVSYLETRQADQKERGKGNGNN